jgi:hypothetical protein
MNVTTEALADWVDYLAECDSGAHWCPDLAGLIAAAPAGSLRTTSEHYGTEGEYDSMSDKCEQMVLHPWTVDSIARWAVLQVAWLDVSEGRIVGRELGETLMALAECGRLSPETADDLADLLARLWDNMIDPDMPNHAFDARDAHELLDIQTEALVSIGL